MQDQDNRIFLMRKLLISMISPFSHYSIIIMQYFKTWEFTMNIFLENSYQVLEKSTSTILKNIFTAMTELRTKPTRRITVINCISTLPILNKYSPETFFMLIYLYFIKWQALTMLWEVEWSYMCLAELHHPA